MTVVAELAVVPVVKGSMAERVARAVDALEGFDVSYETTPMGTIIEGEVEEVFAAAAAAHRAVEGDRVLTTLQVDDHRTSRETAREKVEAVEQFLGREARSA